MGWFSRKKDRAAEPEVEPEEDGPVELGPGPHDVEDVPELGERIDLGALRLPRRDGMKLRLDVDRKTQVVVGVSVHLGDATMQIQVFAAPKTRGIWESLRPELAESVRNQGGSVDEVEHDGEPELLVRMPLTLPDKRKAFRPMRFVGVDGPRWFLRIVISGRAATTESEAQILRDYLSDVVVVRGPEARAPRELLQLSAPKDGASDESEPGESESEDEKKTSAS